MAKTYAELRDTPIGAMSFVAGDSGLQRVAFMTLKALKEMDDEAEGGPSLRGLEILSELMQEMNAYFFGLQRSFSAEVDWGVLEGFQARVLARTAEIPFGEVATYGQIAVDLGRPGGARAVGRALGANPMPVVIPCHRVIGAGGWLRGYSGGLDKKEFLLSLEGHHIKDGRLLPSD